MLKRTLLMTALALSGALVFGATGASAATVQVTTTGDPASPVCPSASNCSFRGAVAGAADGDVIALPAGTYAITQGEVVATVSLTIRGAGRGATVLDASALSPSGSSRALRIAGSVQAVTTIANLSVTGGRILDGTWAGGAGIRCNSRAGIVLSNVRLFDNSVVSTTSPADFQWIGGAGLWSIGTAIIKRDSLIEGNSVTVAASIGQSGGGGVMVPGQYPGANLIVSGSTVRRNSVDLTSRTNLGEQSREGGGGLYAAANDMVLRSATVSSNRATVRNSWGDSGGGGVYVSRGDLRTADTTIEDNLATVTAPADGAFSVFNASSDGGGGAYVSGLNADLVDSEISGNRATANASWGESGGGGIYVSSRDESSGAYVGDLQAIRTNFMGNSVIANPTADENRFASHYGGGAIYQDSHDVVVSESTLSGNSVIVNGESQPLERDSVNGGGAIYQYGNMTSIERSTLSGNTARLPLATRSGGGALMDNAQSSFITNTTFTGNAVTFDETAPSADTNGGGAIIYVQDRDGAVLANVTVASNRVTGSGGGGLLPYSTQLRIGNSIVARNAATTRGTSQCSLVEGAVTSLGYNLSDDATDSCGFDAAGDRLGNPRLASLAANGGPTQTRAIGKKSPAFNRADPAGCEGAFGDVLTVDQRGYPRPSPKGGRCDIGAFEVKVTKKKKKKKRKPKPVTG